MATDHLGCGSGEVRAVFAAEQVEEAETEGSLHRAQVAPRSYLETVLAEIQHHAEEFCDARTSEFGIL